MDKKIIFIFFLGLLALLILWSYTQQFSLIDLEEDTNIFIDDPIVGKWRMDPLEPYVMLYFKSNGKFYYNDTLSGTYNVSEGKLTLSNPVLKNVFNSFNQTLFDYEFVSEELQIHRLDENLERLNKFLKFIRVESE